MNITDIRTVVARVPVEKPTAIATRRTAEACLPQPMEDVRQAPWITLTRLEEARFLDSVAEIRV